MNAMSPPRGDTAWKTVLVIGGGPAGAATAIRLRGHGIATTLVEQKTFPRDKVCGCCLGGAGLDALKHLGCHEVIKSMARPLTRWHGCLDGRCIAVPLEQNLAVSRETLDVELLSRAKSLGTVVEQPVTATIQTDAPEGVLVRFQKDVNQQSQATQQRVFDGVVIAGGLSAAVPGDGMPWAIQPSGPFGVATKVSHGSSFPDDAIVMVCSDDGYVGLVKLEDERIDVAAALRSGAAASRTGSPIQRVVEILRSCEPFRKGRWLDLDAVLCSAPVMTTPPLRRSRLAGRGRVLLVGDAAGYVEPFTGEGMTWALQSGLAAGDFIAAGDAEPSSVADRWPAELDRVLGRQRRACRWIGGALERPWLRKWGGSVMARFPAVVAPVVRHLNRIHSFPALTSGPASLSSD